MKKNYNSFGGYLKYNRMVRGYTLQEAANIIGIPYSALCNYENGRKNPSSTTLEKIAIAYGISQQELLRVQQSYTTYD